MWFFNNNKKDIKKKEELGWQLVDAVRDGNNDEVKRLLNEGADVNFKDSRYARFTPLHWAAYNGLQETCSLLLEKIADISAKNDDGRTPAELARACGEEETAVFLENRRPFQVRATLQPIPAKQPDTKSSVALGDVSVRDLSVILENLSFSSLVEPFQKNGVSGRAISRIESYQDVMDIDESKIKKVVARTFYEDHVVPWQKTGGIPRDLLQPALTSTFSGKANSTSSSGKKESSSAGYIDGTRGVMLVRTASLGRLLDREDLTSEDILEMFWKPDGNIYSLLPRDDFMEATWEQLPGLRYAVVSYQWTQPWHSMVRFILTSKNRVKVDWMWVDCKCLDQMADNKMATISRSDEIYLHAKEYHLIEIGSLTRGWVLYELSSAALPPIVHISTQDPVLKRMIKERLSSTGFAGSEFKVESDRIVVRKKIEERYGNVANFDQEIIKIVNRIL